MFLRTYSNWRRERKSVCVCVFGCVYGCVCVCLFGCVYGCVCVGKSIGRSECITDMKKGSIAR